MIYKLKSEKDIEIAYEEWASGVGVAVDYATSKPELVKKLNERITKAMREGKRRKSSVSKVVNK